MSDSHGTSGDEVDIHGLFGQVMKTIGEDDFSNNINYILGVPKKTLLCEVLS